MMKNTLLKSVFAALFLACMGAAAAAPLKSALRTPADAEKLARQAQVSRLHADIVYKRVGASDLTLDLFLPLRTQDERGRALFAQGTPLVFYFHGGGWQAGRRHPSFEAVRFLSEHGIALAAVSYRFAGEGRTVEDCVVDCFDAARHLALNAEKYGLDTARFFAYGGSAGGHLTLMALWANPADFKGDTALSGAQFRFAGGVAICPPVTFLDLEDPQKPTPFIRSASRFEDVFGERFENKIETARKVSPVFYLSKDIPRTLIMHGDADGIVDIRGSIAAEERAKALGADFTLLRAPHAGHNFKGRHAPLEKLHRQIYLENLLDIILESAAEKGESKK